MFRSTKHWINPDVIQPNGPVFLASAGGSEVFGVSGRRIMGVTLNGVETLFELPARQFGTAMAVSSSGSIFVATLQPGTSRLVVVSTAGTLMATHLLPASTPVLSMVLASDGCTLFYAHGTAIRRIDGCTGTPLADFAVAPDRVTDLFPIAGGDLLVAAGKDVLLYDSSGALVRVVATISTYVNDDEYFPGQIALADDGETLWMTGDSYCYSGTRRPAPLLRIALATGEELWRRELTTNLNFSLILGTPAAVIPTAHPIVLALIALLLGVAGLVALR